MAPHVVAGLAPCHALCMLTGEHHMNAAQKLYASIGGTAVKAALGSLRGWGIDLRNPHTRKAGPGRRHIQG